MRWLFVWFFLLCIWNSILFFGKSLGISVLLFLVPTLVSIIYILKVNHKIKNKYGLLFTIPIILLSSTYFLFDNEVFRTLNIFVIPILFILMYIETIQPTDDIKTLVYDLFLLLFEPFNYFGFVKYQLKKEIKSKWDHSNQFLSGLQSLFIILPIVFIVLYLLSSADMIFGKFFTDILASLQALSIEKLGREILFRITFILILFFYMSSSICFILRSYPDTNSNERKTEHPKGVHTIKLLLLILNVIYIIFDIIQIHSLLLHQVSMDISYAEYARQGFFQLMFVSVINISIIFVSKQYEQNENKKGKRYITAMCCSMILLTFIIIVSSFFRMNLYEAEYGYTRLRLFVYAILITEAVALIPTIFYILHFKVKILKCYIGLGILTYMVLNFMRVDYFIAVRNIERYYKTDKIDILYLENGYVENLPALIDLYHQTNDPDLHNMLAKYFKIIRDDDPYKIEMDGFQEFNRSKHQAITSLNDLDLSEIKNLDANT